MELIFVTPDQYQDARHALMGRGLHPFNLVIAEDLEYLLHEILDSFPSKRRAKVKQGERGQTLLVEAGGHELDQSEWTLEEDRKLLGESNEKRNALAEPGATYVYVLSHGGIQLELW